MDQARRPMLLITALGRLRQGNLWVQVQPGLLGLLHGENLSQTPHCLPKSNNNKKQNPPKWRKPWIHDLYSHHRALCGEHCPSMCTTPAPKLTVRQQGEGTMVERCVDSITEFIMICEQYYYWTHPHPRYPCPLPCTFLIPSSIWRAVFSPLL